MTRWIAFEIHSCSESVNASLVALFLANASVANARRRPSSEVTLGEMRDAGVRGVLIYCADYRCSHSIATCANKWPDHLRLSDLEARFVCKACGKRGADVRPGVR
jgi:hypothetical protein